MTCPMCGFSSDSRTTLNDLCDSIDWPLGRFSRRAVAWCFRRWRRHVHMQCRECRYTQCVEPVGTQAAAEGR